ncbi:MAG: DUF4105 domain-containing protein [Oligoflexia bacterium]|nr:DUF4105 domain-containing protein [Oligoflexia bacterium]
MSRCLPLFLFLFLFLFNNNTNASDLELENKLLTLSTSKYWLRLGHYKKTLLGAYKGQIDNPKFYLASNGKYNPHAELKATLELFLKTKSVDDNSQPQCMYPARYRFINSEFPILAKTIKNAKCLDLNDWMNSLSPQGATIVYASSYPNNPGSTFGHTYLKIISKNESRLQKGNATETAATSHLDLLDYSISYAANTADGFGLFYAYNGIFGGYLGQFTLGPSYMKINEYSDREDRDLWEYNLNIDEEDARRMMYHFWELNQSAYFDYYFFDENCAYQLLTLLEVAKVDWKLTDRVWLYLTPADSIKLIADNVNSIRGIRYRPSLYKRTMNKMSELQENQKGIFKDIINYEKPIAVAKDDAKILETISNYLFFKKQAQLNKLDQKQSELYNQAFLMRSNLEVKGPFKEVTIEAPKNDSPVDAHNSVQVGLTYGDTGRNLPHSTYEEITFRPALHDILNNIQGYSAFTHLEVLKLKLRYYNQLKKLYLEEWKFLDAISLIPYESVEKKYSWHFDFKSYILKDIDSINKLALSFRPVVGYSFAFPSSNEWAIFYTMMGINLEAQSVFRNHLRFGPMLKLGFISNISKFYRFQLTSELISDLFQSSRQKYFTQYSIDQSFILAQNWDLRLHLFWLNRSESKYKNYREGSLTINYHY